MSNYLRDDIYGAVIV